MQKLIIILAIILGPGVSAQVKPGEMVPEIRFKSILNAPESSAKLSRFRGKLVLIDFWATWCGSCLVAMPHLQQLQEKYAGKIQVITVTDETVKRIHQFLSKRPSNLWFAVDTARLIPKLFPHQTIPHTVVISPEGRLIANTSPGLVTEQVVDSILRGQQVHLAVKKDLEYTSIEDLIQTIFPATDTIRSRFLLESELPGGPGLSTTYLSDSIWAGRRITAINCDIQTLYQISYGNFPFGRIVDKTGSKGDPKSYCLDIIVDRKTELLPALRTELKKRFDIQANPGREIREVYVLKIADTARFSKIPLNTSGKRTYYARHGEIDQQAITMLNFADYLENYAVPKFLVLDETASGKKFDIKFSFQPEDPQSLMDVLSGMGLQLVKEKREVDVLIVYKDNTAG
jgi:thiol-disulfide isomerase/thioredoxin